MNSYLLLLSLGYLYFCVAVNPIESSDWETRFLSLDNCTQCDVKQESCNCFDYVGKCTCCSEVSCCICADCTVCWYEQRQLMLMTQIGIFVLFGIGVIGLTIVYCKICNRTRRHTQARRRRIVLHEERDLTTHCSIIENLQGRPPSYNEVIRNAPPVYTSSNVAPPLYTSPYNRTSMQEAPPSYPGTPKPQEKSQDSHEFPPPPVTQHM